MLPLLSITKSSLPSPLSIIDSMTTSAEAPICIFPIRVPKDAFSSIAPRNAPSVGNSSAILFTLITICASLP